MNIALGTDGAASNNRLDLHTEMRTAALLAKAVANDTAAFPARAALTAATLGGARALGLDTQIGSLEPGKLADLAAVSIADPAVLPAYDSVSQLVYACGREHVTDVWVGGVRRVAAGRLIDINVERLAKQVVIWQNRVVS